MLQVFEAAAGWPSVRERLARRIAEQDLASLDDAVAFAVRWHGDQTRPAGEPYAEHLLEVVCVLVEAIGTTDIDVLRAAVLHDVVEDTECSLEDVRERFGDRVAGLVDWVTKPAPSEGQTREEVRVAYLTRLLSAPDDALLVKLADRLSNVQRLDAHPRPEKRRSYYQETVRSVVPLAQSHPWFRQWYAAWSDAFGHLAVDSPDTRSQ
ncbi:MULTISPECIES: HD domain-containing protein [unclassified Parafrankia]|uniref:HD domain-containing protein n=1 Tax=unclassified Parafrankia TaxID=2994368 RepID=UPI000DA46BBD|nr:MULTISPECIES: HD domain-containing protein [unclassified Parafrankia]TCJ34063.1 bifunctional (p)ppGpp synthetase/guanosine-3',5'-bis(diphosphate) 3'-pyrophosphohydrolase [Parafrankia sp. BMG5.11]SQD97787.1 Guanosine polyphosphate synthetase/pyrophosphohydrolase [Parafrankia sp. Ea1.12]